MPVLGKKVTIAGQFRRLVGRPVPVVDVSPVAVEEKKAPPVLGLGAPYPQDAVLVYGFIATHGAQGPRGLLDPGSAQMAKYHVCSASWTGL